MRLWHQDLINKLPRQQLLGQHRECCALRGKGWGKKHSTVDYVFKYNPGRLVNYHLCLMDEMKKRGYKPNDKWSNSFYRGINCAEWKDKNILNLSIGLNLDNYPTFPEHNEEYLKECIDNLFEKGVVCKFMEVK